MSGIIPIPLASITIEPALGGRRSDQQEEGRPSWWKDGLTRSFMHGSTHHDRKDERSKLLARGALGPWL